MDDYIAEGGAVRVIDVFVDELDLSGLGFRAEPGDTGRPVYASAMMLKLFIYGYLNRVHSGRRLEQEARRNAELMWLTGCPALGFKTIADFRKDSGKTTRLMCRKLNLYLFHSLHEVWEIMGCWIEKYNDLRPRDAPGDLPSGV